MDITEFKGLCLKHKNVRLLTGLLSEGKERNILLRGLKASAASVVASSLVEGRNMLIVLDDNEEAGYFYNDLTQLCPGGCVDFFPSSYKRTIKYGIKDPSNEILRTEVLTHLQSAHGKTCIVTSSEALAELVVDKQALSDNTVVLRQGDKLDLSDLVKNQMSSRQFFQLFWAPLPFSRSQEMRFCRMKYLPATSGIEIEVFQSEQI